MRMRINLHVIQSAAASTPTVDLLAKTAVSYQSQTNQLSKPWLKSYSPYTAKTDLLL